MYVYYANNPNGNLRAEDCVIRAICKVTGDDWYKVYAGLSVEGRGLANWGNANHVWDTYLRKQGFKRYICPNDCPFCYSINDFANEHPKGSYESLMNRAPDEHTRMKFERMLSDMR